MWVGDGTFNGAPWQTASVLALAAATFVLCERAPRPRDALRPPPSPRTRADLGRDESRRPSNPRDRAPRGAAGRRRRRDVRGRARLGLAGRATSTTSSTRRRSSCSTGRTRSPARNNRSSEGKNLIWPPLAAFLVSPLTRPLPRGGRLGDRAPRARRFDALAPDRRRPRLARVRGVRALAVGDRRDPHLAPDAASSACWQRSPGATATAVRAPASRSASRARSSSSSGRSASGSRRSAAAASRSSRPPSPPPRCCSSFRSPASTTTFARCSSSGARSTRTATPPFGLLVQAGAPETARSRRDVRARRRAPRRLLAPARASGSRRGGPRPLADRVARLLRRRGDPARGRPAAALGRLARAARDVGPAERGDRRRRTPGAAPA